MLSCTDCASGHACGDTRVFASQWSTDHGEAAPPSSSGAAMPEMAASSSRPVDANAVTTTSLNAIVEGMQAKGWPEPGPHRVTIIIAATKSTADFVQLNPVRSSAHAALLGQHARLWHQDTLSSCQPAQCPHSTAIVHMQSGPNA